MNKTEETMDQMLMNLGMSNSTSKPMPIQCNVCGIDLPQEQIEHPFKKELRWVICACPCKVAANKKFWEDQEQAKKRDRITKALKLSSSMDDIKSMRFDNYVMRKGSESAYQEVQDAIRDFEVRGKLGVFIFGETGNGKSHLTAAGGNQLIAKGHSVIFITEKDLFNRLTATKNFRNPETFGEIMNACLDADLLIWDDFMSSQKLNDDERDWMFQIVNGRERANKPIWITTNLTPVEFSNDATALRLDDKGRIWWRLMGNMNCIYNRAANYRKVKANSRALGMSEEDYEASILKTRVGN